MVIGIESLCRLVGWGEEDAQIDPLVSFSEVTPLFELTDDEQHYITRTERMPLFRRDRFSREKAKGTIRLFCLGGSTVQGRPYSIETAFPVWLRLNLESMFPEKTFEVVNCGGISYASYRLVPILTECLSYQPDMFIVCTGHNEFLEARTYAGLKLRTCKSIIS